MKRLLYRSVRLTLLLATLFVVALSATAKSPVENVLFIISDDLRAGALRCYGDPLCQSPHIDALARRGLVFDRAYCQGTACGPSRRSFMFSRYRDVENVNLGQLFRQHDRYSARVGKIFHMRVPGDIIAGTNGQDYASAWTERFNSSGREAHTPGDYACLNLNIFTDDLENRQSTAMPHRMFVSVQYDGDGSDQPDYKTATKAIELLQQHRDDPFFLAVGFVRPHYPMVAPREFFEPYPWQQMRMPVQIDGDLDDIPKPGIAKTVSMTNPIGKYPDNQKRMWSAYYASITFMDQQLGRIVSELDRLGLSEKTAIIFTSDHGYHLGDHGFWQKANLHEQIIRVPLIVAAPDIAAGRTDSIVELTDLYPTMADLVGLPVPPKTQGKSFLAVLRDAQSEIRRSALSLGRQGDSLRTDRWHYIRYSPGVAELYDMQNDPEQFTNLYGAADHQPVVDRLDAELNQRLTEAIQ